MKIKLKIATVVAPFLVANTLGIASASSDEGNPASLCDHSWSGLVPHNSLDDIRAGYYTGPPFERYRVAVDGDVDWTLDPYQSLSWRMWLDTLGWAGPLIDNYDRTGNKADLELAMAYARDYVNDQPMNASTPDRPVLQQSSRRLQFLSCLYERDPQPWISEAMEGTVDFLSANWAGLYNHGLDQDHSIVMAGCVLGRDDWIEFGRQRLSKTLLLLVSHPCHVSIWPNQHSRRSSHRAEHRKLPRPFVLGVDQLNAIGPGCYIEFAGLG